MFFTDIDRLSKTMKSPFKITNKNVKNKSTSLLAKYYFE